MKKILIGGSLALAIILIFSFFFFNSSNDDKKETLIDEVVVVDNVTKKIERDSVQSFQNSIHSKSGKLDLKEKIDSLDKEESVEEKQKNIFLKSFVGEYSEAKSIKEKLCKVYTYSENCKSREVSFNILSIVDENNKEIKDLDNITLKIDGEPVEYSSSFTLDLSYNFNHRLIISKKGYMSYYKKITLQDYIQDVDYDLNIQLEKYSQYKNTNIGKKNLVKTDNYTFIVEPGSFTYDDGVEVRGDIEIYFFDLEPKQISFFKSDIFAKESLSYLGNHLVNKSTALVKAYKQDEELKIIKPIKVLTNLDNIARKMYLIDLDKIPKDVILDEAQRKQFRIPFIGNINSDSGVWMSTDLKILNPEGEIEFLLY